MEKGTGAGESPDDPEASPYSPGRGTTAGRPYRGGGVQGVQREDVPSACRRGRESLDLPIGLPPPLLSSACRAGGGRIPGPAWRPSALAMRPPRTALRDGCSSAGPQGSLRSTPGLRPPASPAADSQASPRVAEAAPRHPPPSGLSATGCPSASKLVRDSDLAPSSA